MPELPSSRLRAPQPERKDPLQRAVPFTLGMHRESAVTCHPAPCGARAEPPGAGAQQRCLTRARRCERGGDAERGRRSPKRRTPAAGRRGTGERRALLCTEPLESQRGFQMKAIFVLQNLKPPLPRAYERDSSEKWENLRPLTLLRHGAGVGTGRRRQGRGWQSPARPPTPRGSRQRLLRSRSPFPLVRGLWQATIGFRFLLSCSV